MADPRAEEGKIQKARAQHIFVEPECKEALKIFDEGMSKGRAANLG